MNRKETGSAPRTWRLHRKFLNPCARGGAFEELRKRQMNQTGLSRYQPVTYEFDRLKSSK